MNATLDLTRLLTPSAIALVGASANAHAIGGQPLRFMREFGYSGKLYPVNPKRTEVQGIKCYDHVLSIPGHCDAAVIAVPAAHVPGVIRDCGKAGIPYAVVLSAGFDGGSPDRADLNQQLKDAIADSGVRVVGPNSTGVVSIESRSYLAFGGTLADPNLVSGSVAIVSQSGGVGMSMLGHAQQAGIGTNYFVSSGGEVDLDIFDFVDCFLSAPDVSVIALYLESTAKGRRLRELGRRALEVKKPIVVLKAGNTGVAHVAAASHTGRLTARYELFRTAFREGGYIEVADIDELAWVVKALANRKLPAGKRAAILSSSGGWGVMMAERCEQDGLAIPPPSPETAAKMRELVPSYASLRNPIDMTPQGYSDEYRGFNRVASHLLDDPAFDLLLVRSPTGSDVKVWSKAISEIAENSGKYVLVNWAPAAHRYLEEKKYLENHGVLCFSYAGQLAKVASACADFSQKLAKRAAMPGEDPRIHTPISIPLRKTPGAMAEGASKKCLQAYGVPTTREMFIGLDEIEELQMPDLRYPLAVKVESADIVHKTEAGGVILNIRDINELKAAARLVIERVRAHAPHASIEGVLVQEMATGTEMILGAVSDPDFGPYVMCGIGGIFAEIVHDVTYRFAPVNAQQALEMLDEVSGRKILDGARGRPPADVSALCDAIVKLSQLVADHEHDISEIEINPLFVGDKGRGVVAADCLITVR